MKSSKSGDSLQSTFRSSLTRAASSSLSSASTLVSSTARLASDGVNTTASLASDAANSIKTMTPKKRDGHGDSNGDEMIKVINDIGLNGSSRVKDRDSGYKLFDTVASKQHDKVIGVTQEMFVKTLLIERFNIQWSDAAFRAMDSSKKGYLTRDEFLLALTTLKTSSQNMENSAWQEQRRRVLFSYYNRSENDCLCMQDFDELMRDMSTCLSSPEWFGVANRQWRVNQGENSKVPGIADHDEESIVKELVMTKLQFALKKSELESVQAECYKLKKQLKEQESASNPPVPPTTTVQSTAQPLISVFPFIS